MAAGATYEPISTQTLSNSTTQTVTFSSISGAYTDLLLVINGGMATTTGYSVSLRLNSDTGNNYSSTRLYAPAVASDRLSNVSQIYTLQPATNSLDSVHLFHIMNYSNTTTYKTVLARNSSRGYGSDGVVGATVGLWRSTSAITSISLSPEFTANWYSGTTFTLYGIAAA